MRRRGWAMLVGPALMLAMPLSAGAAPVGRTVSVPVPGYPVAPPGPEGDSRLPQFYDEDELVVAQLHPDGSVASVVDTINVKMRGQGDFAITLPGPAQAVLPDPRSDAAAGLQGGHVNFLGFLNGDGHVSAQVTLDPARYLQAFPLGVDIGWSNGTTQVDPRQAAGKAGVYILSMKLSNLTGVQQVFQEGTPDRGQLAAMLEALRGVPDVYTPETDLAALFPLPPHLDLAAPITSSTHTVFAPLSVTVAVRLDSGATVAQAPGASVATDPRQTVATWTLVLPRDVLAAGAVDLQLVFRTKHFRAPGIEIKADARPLPAALFQPPCTCPWATHLRTATGLPALALRGQLGLASLNRIADVVPPLGRPGAGPMHVAYDLVLPSGDVIRQRPAPLPPLRPQPLALALTLLAFAVVSVNAFWAWSRS